MSVDRKRLETILNPKGIAIIGASERGMYPSGIIKNLVNFGYPHEIFPINPNRDQVFGIPCYPEIEKAPSKVDLAIIVVNRERVITTLEQCARAGVPSVLIITANFAEYDQRGKVLQEQVAEIIRQNNLVALGPNCAGFANLPAKIIATRLPCAMQTGGLSFISQSGALMMALYGVFADQQMGLNKILSVGNQVDINLSEALQYLADDPGTTHIGAFIEGLQDGKAFVDGLERALVNGKLIVLIKSGRTKIGSQIAATHTAAIAGSDKVFTAICHQFGAILVDDITEMINVLKIQNAYGKSLSNINNIVIVTQSGGMGSLTADWFEKEKLNLKPISNQFLKTLKKDNPNLSHLSSLNNPIDVRGASLRGDATAVTLRPFFTDPQIDFLFLLLARTAYQDQDLETARAIIEIQHETKKPLIVVWTGQRDKEKHAITIDELFKHASIPVYKQSSDAVRSLAALQRYWSYRSLYLSHQGSDETTQ
jgi:acyl-CoA synthetase (NDP forming)